MGFPKIDINDVMSSVEKQKEFYDLVLDYLEKISGKLTVISIALHYQYDNDPTPEELANEEIFPGQLSCFDEDYICPADEVLGGNE